VLMRLHGYLSACDRSKWLKYPLASYVHAVAHSFPQVAFDNHQLETKSETSNVRSYMTKHKGERTGDSNEF
jgi:hypothetical protein